MSVSFNTQASNIIRGYKAFDKAGAALNAIVTRELQFYIDAHIVAGTAKDEKGCKALQKGITQCEAVLNVVASGAMEKKTFTEYAQGAARAFYYGVPFAADLKNNPEFKLPWGKAGTANAAKSGKVTSTTRESLDQTLSKAIEQARALGLTEFAAEVLDLALESLDGFSEIK